MSRFRAMRPELSFANVVSCLALFVALGGTSYAVARNSVGTPQLKKDAVTSPKVKDGSLTLRDFAAGTLTRGPRGERGPAGATGPAGAAGTGGAATAAEEWKPLPYATGWGDYAIYDDGHPRGAYRKDADGTVRLRGMTSNLAGTSENGQTIAVLPPGYRPSRRQIHIAIVGQPASAGRVNIETDGSIVRSNLGASGENDYVSLAGITFSPD